MTKNYRPRTTMRMSEPHQKVTASLSWDAAVALAYGIEAISSNHPRQAPASAITRRSLELYAQRLKAMSAEELSCEARAVEASAGSYKAPQDASKAFQYRKGL